MNLLNFLKQNSNTRKIFGKRELKIIEKQLNGVDLTQSEKNRLSRDIRKKFEFIKEASNFSNEFELKKSSEIRKKVENAKFEILQDEFSRKIKKIIWFGSFLERKATLDSDIDISVEFFSINKKEATLFRKRILGKIDSKIDLQVYNYLPEKIRKEIDLKGKIINDTYKKREK